MLVLASRHPKSIDSGPQSYVSYIRQRRFIDRAENMTIVLHGASNNGLETCNIPVIKKINPMNDDDNDLYSTIKQKLCYKPPRRPSSIKKILSNALPTELPGLPQPTLR